MRTGSSKVSVRGSGRTLAVMILLLTFVLLLLLLLITYYMRGPQSPKSVFHAGPQNKYSH